MYHISEELQAVDFQDVTNMYTNIPRTQTVIIISKKLKILKGIQIKNILHATLQQNFFNLKINTSKKKKFYE